MPMAAPRHTSWMRSIMRVTLDCSRPAMMNSAVVAAATPSSRSAGSRVTSNPRTMAIVRLTVFTPNGTATIPVSSTPMTVAAIICSPRRTVA